MRTFTHIALAAALLVPSFAVPQDCGAAIAEAGEAFEAGDGASCCSDGCQCPASMPDPVPCSGGTCASAPSTPLDESLPAATLPQRPSDDGKLSLEFAPESSWLEPSSMTNASASWISTPRASGDPPGKRLLTLCRFLN